MHAFIFFIVNFFFRKRENNKEFFICAFLLFKNGHKKEACKMELFTQVHGTKSLSFQKMMITHFLCFYFWTSSFSKNTLVVQYGYLHSGLIIVHTKKYLHEFFLLMSVHHLNFTLKRPSHVLSWFYKVLSCYFLLETFTEQILTRLSSHL